MKGTKGDKISNNKSSEWFIASCKCCSYNLSQIFSKCFHNIVKVAATANKATAAEIVSTAALVLNWASPSAHTKLKAALRKHWTFAAISSLVTKWYVEKRWRKLEQRRQLWVPPKTSWDSNLAFPPHIYLYFCLPGYLANSSRLASFCITEWIFVVFGFCATLISFFYFFCCLSLVICN